MLMTYLLSEKGYVIAFCTKCHHGVELKQYVITYVIGGGVSSMHVITCVIAYVISCYGVLRVALMTHDDYIYQ